MQNLSKHKTYNKSKTPEVVQKTYVFNALKAVRPGAT